MSAKLKTMVFVVLIASTTTLYAQHTGLNEIEPVKNFEFEPKEQKVLPGKTPETVKDGVIQEDDIIGNLGLVSLFYQNACYTDGRYNHNNFSIEKGIVSDGDGTVQLEAYRVSEPASKAQNFLASEHNVCFRFDKKQDYAVYQFENNSFKKIAIVPASDIKPSGFTQIKDLKVSKIKGSVIYVFAPANTAISTFHKTGSDSEAALINSNELWNVYQIRYPVNGTPIDIIEKNYLKTRHYFAFQLESGKTGLIWQDTENQNVFFSTIEQNVTKCQTIKLINPNNGFLAAATGTEQGELFYLTISDDENEGVNAMLSKQNSKTGSNLKNNLDVSENEMNMFAYGNETASLSLSGDKLLLMIARTMHKSSDGLNHQGGIAVLFDASTLNQLRNYGQTSGHSFDNYLMVNSIGEFIGMDLGDNYPRGVNLHHFSENMFSKVVYTFKTEHGTTANCYGIKDYPLYPEISTSAKKYYKWSNDNATYTELGNIVETTDGYLISFLGEPDNEGKALNNKEVGKLCSRNVGFVKVKKDFSASGDDLILSEGISEKGGFYTFGGWWSEQKNEGIVWLTNYQNPNTETAKYLKTLSLKDGNILFMWELWAGSEYKQTLALKADQNGNPLGDAIDLGSNVRLNRRDDLLSNGNQILIFNGKNVDKMLEMTIIELKND